jgi:hypothetical protein
MEETLKLALALCLAVAMHGADPVFPQADISNGIIKAKILLPDAQRGYYRGSRFDWDGVIESLSYKGHNFFGQWFPHYEPTLHDAIMGPVEEFRGDEGALGFNEAKVGGYFIKIGIGILRRTDDEKYFFAKPYPIVNTGKRVVTPESDRVKFEHDLNSGEGYAYVYKKTLLLPRGKAELVIEHSLKNVGRRPIDTTVYNHDFYMIDNQPTGPDYRVKFAFAPHAENDLKDLAEIRGNDLVYKRELKPKGESAATPITGFGSMPQDNDVTVENTKAKAGVREIGNRPLSSFYFWSIHSTVCPEGYIRIHVEPGQTFKWKITYQFFELP